MRIIFWILSKLIAGVGRTAVLPFSREWMGLGNRLKGVCNFYSLGFRRILLLWRVDDYISASFSDLFNLKGCCVFEFNPANKLYRILTFFCRRFLPQGVVTNETPFWSFFIPKEMVTDCMAHYWSFSPNKKTYSVDWWYNRTPENIREYFRPFFEALEPSDAVRRRIAEVDFAIEDCVCVQIRFSGNSKDAKSVCSVESIINQMLKYPESTHFFITYFADAVGQQIKEAFPGRIHELPHKNCQSMIDAVAEIWLLGRGREIIASPQSTFVEFAWWWGGATQQVTEMVAEFNQSAGH